MIMLHFLHSSRAAEHVFAWSRRLARMAVLAGLIGVAAEPVLVRAAYAQTFPDYPVGSPLVAAASVTPRAYFEYANLFGSGNIVRYTRLPVRTSTGAFKYYDVTTQFNVSSTGALTIASGYPKIEASPLFLVSTIKAGRYVSFTAPSYRATLTGPGAGPSGFSVWTWQREQSASSYTIPNVATFYVGPISSPQHPLYARLKNAGITSSWYTYGVISEDGTNVNFGTGDLVGITQNGKTLTIYSFSPYNKPDQANPVDHVVYNLSP